MPLRRLARRLAATGLVGVLLAFAVASCSLDAALVTSRSGHVVDVSSLRLRSTWQELAVSLVLGDDGLAVELSFLGQTVPGRRSSSVL